MRRALPLAVLLTLAPAASACGGEETSAADRAARNACKGITREDLDPGVDRLDHLRETEQLAVQAANADPRYDALYDARRDLRRSTEERNSKAALEAGLRVLRECRKIDAAG